MHESTNHQDFTDRTYSIGLAATSAELGNLEGQRWLDFGCGVGRTAKLLRGAGAQVTAVDHDPKKIAKLQADVPDGITAIHVNGSLPCSDSSHDGALAYYVFQEMRSLQQMND